MPGLRRSPMEDMTTLGQVAGGRRLTRGPNTAQPLAPGLTTGRTGTPGTTTPGMSTGSAVMPDYLNTTRKPGGNDSDGLLNPPQDYTGYKPPPNTGNDNSPGGDGTDDGVWKPRMLGHNQNRGTQRWDAWRAQIKPRMDRDLATFGQYFGNDDRAAAAVMGSSFNNGTTARDQAVINQYFGGDRDAYRSWLQTNLQQGGLYSYDGDTGSMYGDNGLMKGPGRTQAGGVSVGGPGAGGNGTTTLGSAARGDSPGYGVDVNRFLDPSRDFRLRESLDAMEQSAAARGSLASGETMRALSDRASDYASQEYGAAWNRAANVRDFTSGLDRYDQEFDYRAQTGDRAFDYQRLSDLARMGLSGANSANSGATAIAGMIAALLGNRGSIAAAGTQGSNGNITSGIQQLVNFLIQNGMIDATGLNKP